MRTSPDFLTPEQLERYREQGTQPACVDWKASPGDVLVQVDTQLKKFGLEVHDLNFGGDSYLWIIERRKE